MKLISQVARFTSVAILNEQQGLILCILLNNYEQKFYKVKCINLTEFKDQHLILTNIVNKNDLNDI